MIEHWQRSVVSGSGENVNAREVILHKRGQDPLNMAMRRNPDMPACSVVYVFTREAFTQIREDERRRTRAEIPRDDRQGEEFEW